MTREDPTVQTVSSVSALMVVVEPVAELYPGPLSVQPVIMAMDQQVRLIKTCQCQEEACICLLPGIIS